MYQQAFSESPAFLTTPGAIDTRLAAFWLAASRLPWPSSKTEAAIMVSTARHGR